MQKELNMKTKDYQDNLCLILQKILFTLKLFRQHKPIIIQLLEFMHS
jgi:hypothetical protein